MTTEAIRLGTKPSMEEMGGDLLVMGMHRRGGVAGWLGSSITEEVVREAHCPVVTVRVK